MIKKWFLPKNILISRLEYEKHTLFMTKMAKISWNRYPIYDKNGCKTILFGRTYLHSPCKGVPPPTSPRDTLNRNSCMQIYGLFLKRF